MNIFVYFTIWSLLISYSIFVWSIFLYLPGWLFLFAACFLTTTSIMGTFFLTMPILKNEADKVGATTQKVILEDALIHSGPLILFLLLFYFIAKNTLKRGKYDHYKIAVLATILSLSYLGYIKFEQIYFYDYFTLIVLSLCVFVSSYQIYSNILD